MTNDEIAREALDAYNRGDLAAALKHAAPDCKFDWSRSIGPQRGVYGPDDFRQLDLAQTLESVRIEPQEFIEAGEHLITPLIGYARGRDGMEVTARFTSLWTFRDGTVVGVTLYQERHEALEAVGLAE
jgi:ketosteroid isomerase-like protein